MKLREGWKSHGREWRYKEDAFGACFEAVLQITQFGQKRYEAHYWENKCCGFANNPLDFWKFKRFDNRDEAFDFCEAKYSQRTTNSEA